MSEKQNHIGIVGNSIGGAFGLLSTNGSTQ